MFVMFGQSTSFLETINKATFLWKYPQVQGDDSYIV